MTQLEILIKGYEIGIKKNPVSGGIELAKIAATLKPGITNANQCDSCSNTNLGNCLAMNDGGLVPNYSYVASGMSGKVNNCTRYKQS